MHTLLLSFHIGYFFEKKVGYRGTFSISGEYLAT